MMRVAPSPKRDFGGYIPLIVVSAVALGGIYSLMSYTSSVSKSTTVESRSMSVLTWNMAAINNNPFEYWITNDDPVYGKMMEGVSRFIKSPGDEDVPVSSVFTEAMFQELKSQMNKVGWDSVDSTEAYWNANIKNRKIISEFIKDEMLGKKRLVSMPDRITNTIATSSGDVHRPTVVNCYAEDLTSSSVWWKKWKKFMFDHSIKHKDGDTNVYKMLTPISKAKYPSITEEEAAMSLPLQTLSLAVFDSILVHMMNRIQPKWTVVRKDICINLNQQKNAKTMEILSSQYDGYKILFMQEVGNSFITEAQKNKYFQKNYDMFIPFNRDPNRDQNSVIFLRKGYFSDVVEVTAEVLQEITDEKSPISKGDFIGITTVDAVTKDKLLLGSFHGDTNGLATKAITSALHYFAVTKRRDHKIIFGLDANTYGHPESDQQGVEDYALFFTELKMNSVYSQHPDPNAYTTFNARTYLQPQLNKAITFEERNDIGKGDKNPKDFILFFDADFSVERTMKDNTGQKKFVENMMFPTLAFPSDHAITSSILIRKSSFK